MNELQNMILIDVKEALFDICFKYEKMLGIEFDNGVDPEIEMRQRRKHSLIVGWTETETTT